MKKILILFENSYHQELWDPSTETNISSVSDLYECPEDAIIGRSLIDCNDVSRFLRLGMKYRDEGYGSIELEYVTIPDEDDADEFIEEYLEGWKLLHKKN